MDKEKVAPIIGGLSTGLSALIAAFFEGLTPLVKEDPLGSAICIFLIVLFLFSALSSGALTWSMISPSLEEKLKKVCNNDFPSRLVSWLAVFAFGFFWCWLGSIWTIPTGFDPAQAEMRRIASLILYSSLKGLPASVVIFVAHVWIASYLKDKKKRELKERLETIESNYTDACNKFDEISRDLTASIARIEAVQLRKSCQEALNKLMDAHNRILGYGEERNKCQRELDKLDKN